MISAPSVTSVALLVALSLFLGLAFEDFFARTDTRRPGGIRTFPMLALAGGVLYLFDRANGTPLFPIEERRFPESAVDGERTAGTQPIVTKPAPFARQLLTEAMLTTRACAERRRSGSIASVTQSAPS